MASRDPLWMRALGQVSRWLNKIRGGTPGAPLSYDIGMWLRSKGYSETVEGPWWLEIIPPFGWWYDHFLETSRPAS